MFQILIHHHNNSTEFIKPLNHSFIVHIESF